MSNHEVLADVIEDLKRDIPLIHVPAPVIAWMHKLADILDEMNQNTSEVELKVRVYEDSFEDIEHRFDALEERPR
jgi:chaperonin cofactor prefoldin